MPDPRRRTCRDCGARDTEVGLVSWNGYCTPCQHRRMQETNDSIRAKEGPGHERRRYGIARELLGPRVALALKQAGVFGPLDESQEGV